MIASYRDGVVSRKQLLDLTREVGRDCHVIDKLNPQETPIFKGQFNLIKLRDGLTLHSADGYDDHNLTTQTQINPRIGLMLFLNGQCDACYGERKITLGVKQKKNQVIVPEIVLVSVNRQETFSREAQAGRYLKKIVVAIEPEWLEKGGFDGLEGYQRITQFFKQHLAVERHLMTPQMRSITEKILNPPDTPAFLKNLYIEGLTLEMVAEAFKALTTDQSILGRDKLHPYERKRVNKVLELLESSTEIKEVSLDLLAKEVGTTSNTLQRSFRHVMGMTIFDYLRSHKLTQAKNALENNQVNVLEAALLAGYGSAANFSTAFKRQFGVSPNQIKRCYIG